MPDPISFTSATPRWSLPHLFAAQAQKEFIVNETLARLDLLLHCAVRGERDDPPEAPVDGEAWIVGDMPVGAWTDHTAELAAWQAGAWIFVQPRDGARVFDIATGQIALWRGGWQRPEAPLVAEGGATVDTQARQVIANLIETLRNAGIFATP